MGLDMFAFHTKSKIAAADFDHPKDASHFFYWRQRLFVHLWLRDLYYERGGKEKEFNCTLVRIDAADIDDFEKLFRRNRWLQAEDKDFIREARKLLAKGRRVYYGAWY